MTGNNGTGEQLLLKAKHALESLQTKLAEVTREVDNGFVMLSAYGVPKERTKHIGTGIGVLGTRFRKERRLLEGELAQTRMELGAQQTKVVDLQAENAALLAEVSQFRNSLEALVELTSYCFCTYQRLGQEKVFCAHCKAKKLLFDHSIEKVSEAAIRKVRELEAKK